MLEDQMSPIAAALLDFGNSIPRGKLYPTVVPEAAALALSDPYAFALATCLNRGLPAEVIWTIPYDIKEKLGHLDPYKIRLMSILELERLVDMLPRRPRYTNDAPRTIHELTMIICDELGGDASKLWVGRTASQVKRLFMRVHGVGNGIANMAVLLIEKVFGIEFDDIDRPHMDIKPDTHTMRVLYRLGVSNEKSPGETIRAARLLHPQFPGALDPPLWVIGREFCHPSSPACSACPVEAVCKRAGLGPY